MSPEEREKLRSLAEYLQRHYLPWEVQEALRTLRAMTQPPKRGAKKRGR